MKKKIVLFLLVFVIIPTFAQDSKEFYQKLLLNAPKTVGLKEFPSVNNFRYNGDCSGFIAFLFHVAGLNLLNLYGIGTSGVEAIWNGLNKYDAILIDEPLEPGDIVFFDNTYDKNNNGLWDDKFSHIGIVEFIDEYGTATYLHYGSKGVARARMNLSHPYTYSAQKNGVKYRYNDLLRNSSVRGVNPDFLSGALYKGAARVSVSKKK